MPTDFARPPTGTGRKDVCLSEQYFEFASCLAREEDRVATPSQMATASFANSVADAVFGPRGRSDALGSTLLNERGESFVLKTRVDLSPRRAKTKEAASIQHTARTTRESSCQRGIAPGIEGIWVARIGQACPTGGQKQALKSRARLCEGVEDIGME